MDKKRKRIGFRDRFNDNDIRLSTRRVSTSFHYCILGHCSRRHERCKSFSNSGAVIYNNMPSLKFYSIICCSVCPKSPASHQVLPRDHDMPIIILYSNEVLLTVKKFQFNYGHNFHTHCLKHC